MIRPLPLLRSLTSLLAGSVSLWCTPNLDETFVSGRAVSGTDAGEPPLDAGELPDAAPEQPCSPGSFRQPLDAGATCTPWTDCGAGQYVLRAGSTTEDRACAPCAAESFSTEVNAPACDAWTVCDAGHFVSEAGSVRSDRSCEPCANGSFSDAANRAACGEWSECQPGQYIEGAGSATEDRSCADCPDGRWSDSVNAPACIATGECEPGTAEVAPASETEPGSCSACEPGEHCPGGASPRAVCSARSWDHDADPATPCEEHTTCEPGSYVAAVGGNTSDQRCAECASGTFSSTPNAGRCTRFRTCEAGTFVARAGSSEGDAECASCASGSYSDAAGQESCISWTDCEPGEFVTTPGTASGDRECAICEPGTNSTSVNSGACVAPDECVPGSVLVTTDGGLPEDCAPCAAGEYCAGADAEAVTCTSGSWDDDQDPATPCVDQTVCTQGSYMVDAGDAVSDRACAPCEAGEFSSTENAEVCTAWQTCEAGTTLASPGTASADKTCTPCSPGTFSEVQDASACVAWSACPAPSFYELSAPSAEADRTCAPCADPARTLEDNQAECGLPAFQMTGGVVVMEAEHFDEQLTNGSSHSWQVTQQGGASNGECMVVNPDAAYTWSDPVGFAPELRFRIELSTSEALYLHLLGNAGVSGAGSDTCFAGLDGVPLPLYDFDDGASVWSWATQSLSIDAEGQYTLHAWAREDGFCLDKLVVSTSPTPPAGMGPAESPHL